MLRVIDHQPACFLGIGRQDVDDFAELEVECLYKVTRLSHWLMPSWSRPVLMRSYQGGVLGIRLSGENTHRTRSTVRQQRRERADEDYSVVD